ncbi:DUF58 domain-containing protein [Methylothermus subterraneus]|nr:hypothetical conserved protein [uncultured Gammaproteobacteria bacterium]BAL54430.1 hypothetical conserved protein [uncultured Gammaproteobacteria bacterium]BAL55759.1 hypothetical conserved protein [uncultured Gammaproteobacteria bacterium]
MNRIQLRPTRRLGGFALLLALLWLVSANYGNNLGYLLTYLLAGVGLVSPFLTRRQLLNLRWRLLVPRPVFAGETAELCGWLESLTSLGRQVQVSAPGASAATVWLDGAKQVILSCPTARRGRRRIGPIVLKSTFPLGLFEARLVLPEAWELWIYPKPAEQAPWPFGSRLPNQGAPDFQGLRSYRLGDSVRQIHWKGLAKGQGLWVKEFAEEFEEKAAVFTWEGLPPADAEQRLAWLCRLVLDAEKAGLTYGLKLPERTLPPACGQDHLHACLKALAAFGGDGRD